MINIPMNTYTIKDDPRIEELAEKCLNGIEGHQKGLKDAEEVFINLCPIGDYQREYSISCGGDGNEHIVREVLNHFAKAGYHCAMYNNGHRYIWAKIHKKPIDSVFGVNVLA